MAFTTQHTIPGYTAGTWSIDAARSRIGFSVRHTMVGRVRGTFKTFSGHVVTGERPLDSSVTASIEMGSVDTGHPRRDDHLRSADFFDIAAHPTMDFISTSLCENAPRYVLDGQLSIKAVTKPIALDLDLRGFRREPDGEERVGVIARGELNRSDFDVDFNLWLEVGGVLIADRVSIAMEIEAVLMR